MSKIVSIIFLIVAKYSFGQGIDDTSNVQNVIKFDSIVNSRLDLCYYHEYDIGYSETLVLAGAIDVGHSKFTKKQNKPDVEVITINMGKHVHLADSMK